MLAADDTATRVAADGLSPEPPPRAAKARSVGTQACLPAAPEPSTEGSAASAEASAACAGWHSPSPGQEPRLHPDASAYDQLLAGALALPVLDDLVVRKTARRNMPPEKAAFLKAWLLSPKHINNPYPTDEVRSGRLHAHRQVGVGVTPMPARRAQEKEALAAKLNLSMRQLSTWFTNARKRMWKPLVVQGHVLPRPGDEEEMQDAACGTAAQRPRRQCAARATSRRVARRLASADSSSVASGASSPATSSDGDGDGDDDEDDDADDTGDEATDRRQHRALRRAGRKRAHGR